MNRLEYIKEYMLKNKYDIVMITDSMSIFYLMNLSVTAGTMFITMDEVYFLTDYRYASQVAYEREDIITVDMAKDVSFFALYQRLDDKFSNAVLAYDGTDAMKAFMPKTTFVPLNGLIEQMRVNKSPEEIEKIRTACSISDNAFEEMLDYIKPGMSEREVAIEIEYSMKKKGADQSMAYDIVVGSGYRSSFAHAKASDKIIEKDDVILLDFGCKYKGYCSDLSRTIFIGKANEQQNKIYNIVSDAQNASIQALRVGIQTSEIDKIARQHCEKFGYGENYGVGVGHGIGTTVAENPVMIDVPGFFPSYPLEVGNVVTVEPAIYLPNQYGIRIEDNLLITKFGSENLVHASKNMIELNY